MACARIPLHLLIYKWNPRPGFLGRSCESSPKSWSAAAIESRTR
jgi:hypothetical protein